MNTRLKLVTFALAITLLILTVRTDTFSILISGDPEALRTLSYDNITTILLLTLMLMIIQNILTLIPLLLLISVNVSIFGFVEGYFWSWFSSVVGAVISFLITRYWFQNFFIKYVNDKLKQRIDEKGFWFVFTGRILPFMPTSVVNIAAGISSIQFKKFLYATLVGNLIYFLFLSFISEQILFIVWENLLFTSIAIIILLAIILITLWRKKREREKKKVMTNSTSEMEAS